MDVRTELSQKLMKGNLAYLNFKENLWPKLCEWGMENKE